MKNSKWNIHYKEIKMNKYNIKVMDGDHKTYYPNTIDHYTSLLFRYIYYSRRNNDCNVIGILVIKNLK